MTEVAFHFNAPDKLPYACRLLRKVWASGARSVVTGEPAMLDALDQALWTFSALDFLPHCRADAPAHVLSASPIVLAPVPTALPGHDVLVNLGSTVPAGFEQFGRLVEVVGADDADRAPARTRWKHYADRGYPIVRHDLAARHPAGSE